MSNPIIRIEQLSKCYNIGVSAGDDGLRHRIDSVLRNPARLLRSRRSQARQKEFWALRNVSFEIEQGDVVGVVGRNGAGKSTLLKILSRITTPTSGRLYVKGRMASLLEVGTGFHQELTGRENIFLNGAVLGMKQAEIKRKFDEIVAFSEVEEFLDTPVKRYSSGMYVRLAFAVAAHLEPEILVVDEVLAVGDAQFQKKCLGKMESAASQGRTVLFVSHNIAAVRNLCSKGVLLSKGTVQKFGTISEVVDSYLNDDVVYSGRWTRQTPVTETDVLYFEEVRILGRAGELVGHLDCTDDFIVEIRVRSKRSFDNAQVVMRITNQDGVVAFTTCNTDLDRKFIRIHPGVHTFHVRIPGNFLVPGTYTLQLVTHIPETQRFDLIDNTIAVCIEETGTRIDKRLGVVNPVLDWVCQ